MREGGRREERGGEGRRGYFLTTVTLGSAASRLEASLSGVRERAMTSCPDLERVSTTATPVFPVAPDTTILILIG